MVDYGHRLQQALTQANLAIQPFADRLGVSYHAVRKVLKGESKGFSSANHARACAILNIDPDWLALGKGPMTRQTQAPQLPQVATDVTSPYQNPPAAHPASQQLQEAIAMLQALPAGKLAEAHRFLSFLSAG